MLALLAVLAGGGCRDTSPTAPAPNDRAAAVSRLVQAHVERHALEQWIASRNLRYAPLREVSTARGMKFVMSPPGSHDPVPIPGGFASFAHVFAPGPAALGFQGEDVEPNVMTNFRGFTALGYPVGQATGSDGKTYDMFNDMRVFTGEYVAADGHHKRGTFVFT
jgi:hypothetical protein